MVVHATGPVGTAAWWLRPGHGPGLCAQLGIGTLLQVALEGHIRRCSRVNACCARGMADLVTPVPRGAVEAGKFGLVAHEGGTTGAQIRQMYNNIIIHSYGTLLRRPQLTASSFVMAPPAICVSTCKIPLSTHPSHAPPLPAAGRVRVARAGGSPLSARTARTRLQDQGST